jgi:hypothetical protein
VSINGKQKGSGFERECCTALSKWITNGERIDCLWRAAMSGGRATVQKGKVRQSGDITAVAPEGHALTDKFYIECKAYKELGLDCFIKGKGTLIDFWKIAGKESVKYDKHPILIFKQNNWPTVFVTSFVGSSLLKSHDLVFLDSPEFDMRLIRFNDLLKIPFPL